MRLSAMCIRCLMDRQEERLNGIGDERKKSAYMKEIASMIGSSGEDVSAPYLIYKINSVYKRYFGGFPSYEKEKKEYNDLMLSMEKELEEDIRSGGDSGEILRNALSYARCANYIDFATGNRVCREELLKLLGQAKEEEVDADTFAAFQSDMEKAGRLVFLTDNCGEIVMDKLLIKILREQYKNVEVTVIVRGEEVLNDATMKDAEAAGLTDYAKVIDNGNGVAGTQISLLSDEARSVIGKADVIISKGQGNFETIHECGLNIYYLFLCKCEWFSGRFGMERLKGVFINEHNLP